MDAGRRRTPEQWGEAFQHQREDFLDYTAALERLLKQLLSQENIPYVQIEARTKEVPNFVSKLRRKNEKYLDPLREVTDLSGIRVVLYYSDDVERVGDLIAAQFTVDFENSVDKGASMDPDRFGYLSVHYVVRPSAARSRLPEWGDYADVAAEIQVRTVLQHAWGAISRKLAYASLQEAPRDLQRSLNRLSALLELADDEFVDIRMAREEIERQYDREVEQGNLDLAIDESSLEIYLRESGVGDRIAELAREAGSPTDEDKNEFWGEDELEIEEQRQSQMRTLLRVIGVLGIDRIADLDRKLDLLWGEIPEFMRHVNERYSDDDDRPISDYSVLWLTLILLWSVKASPTVYSDVGFVEELVGAIVTADPGEFSDR